MMYSPAKYLPLSRATFHKWFEKRVRSSVSVDVDFPGFICGQKSLGSVDSRNEGRFLCIASW